MRGAAGLFALAWLSAHAPAGAQQPGPQAATAGLSVGVAPFESAGQVAPPLPDVAGLLARRLTTRGLERVVGPESLGAAALARPAAEEVVRWASAADLDALVVGRATRLGSRISIDAQVRSGASGASLGAPLVAEAAGPADVAEAVDRVAAGVVARLATGAGAPAVSAPPPGPEAKPAAAETPRKGDRLGGLRSDAPISIKSDELDVLQKGGGRRFLFKGHVRAEQDQLTLRSDQLEAEYPEDDGQPDRLVATGHVEMTHAGRKALCDRAVYYRREQRLVCTGNAQLEQACDRVRGEEIVFHVDSEILEVNGAADVRIHPKGAACPAAGNPS